MRFDDSLRTVLSAETSSDAGARAAWRQLVDLLGRRRAPADEAALARLEALRDTVPTTIRAASARSLAFAEPPAALVRFFGEDSLEVAAPVLRTAALSGREWVDILPRLTPAGRSVLRHRRDLPTEATRALAAFGATDFVLPQLAAVEVANDVAPPAMVPAVAPAAAPVEPPRFEIADLVARIDAFNRTRERPASIAAVVEQTAPATAFRFETDATGTICWVDGVARGALIGLELARAERQGVAQVDGGVAGACRRRSAFRDCRLAVAGTGDAGGDWRVSGVPAFDPASGRFIGYRGQARRPRADETATAPRSPETSDSLRQLVHELRTPTNAIAGFAELIETQLFGALAPAYLQHAATIRDRTATLIGAIEDLDTAARIDGGALHLRPGAVMVRPLIARVLNGLTELCAIREISFAVAPVEATVLADEAMLERLLARLLATLAAAANPGDRLGVTIGCVADQVTLAFDRPAGMDGEAGGEESLLLGTRFALRLASRLAGELGGALLSDTGRLTLRLPAAVDQDMGQASIN